MNKWKVTMEPANEEKFRVYRLINLDEQDCLSNREYSAGRYKTYKDAAKAAEYMNILEGRCDY